MSPAETQSLDRLSGAIENLTRAIVKFDYKIERLIELEQKKGAPPSHQPASAQ
jgi:hypothetical protein